MIAFKRVVVVCNCWMVVESAENFLFRLASPNAFINRPEHECPVPFLIHRGVSSQHRYDAIKLTSIEEYLGCLWIIIGNLSAMPVAPVSCGPASPAVFIVEKDKKYNQTHSDNCKSRSTTKGAT